MVSARQGIRGTSRELDGFERPTAGRLRGGCAAVTAMWLTE